MGGTCSPELLQVAMEIWDDLLVNGIAVVAEYLPSSLNIQAGNPEITEIQVIGN